MKTVPVKFNSLKDWIMALLEGKKLKCGNTVYSYNHDGFIVERYDGKIHCFDGINSTMWSSDLWEEVIETPWYEELDKYPKGVLCWVSDSSKDDRSKVENVISYDKSRSYSFGTTTDYMAYATPVTPEEVQHLIYKPSEAV